MSRRPRILIEATPLASRHMSGVGHATLETIRALDTEDYNKLYDVQIFVPFNERKALERFNFKYVRIVSLPIIHKVFSLLSRFPVGVPLDIFLGKGVYVFPNYRNWTLLFSTSVTYIHDVCFKLYPQFVQEQNRNYLQKYMKLWLHRADKIVTVSESSRNEIIDQLGVVPSFVWTVLNGVDKKVFYPRSADEVASVKQKYGIAGRYFLYLGNIEPRKNLETLIRSFRRSGMKDVTLVLVGGDGWLNETVYAEIADAQEAGFSIIKNKTYVPDEDIPALMTGAIRLVQPSWHEGFGIAVVQALACSTEAICADIPSLREVAKGNEDYVAFFDPAKEQQLTGLLKDSASERQKNRGPAPAISTWSEAAEKLMKVVFPDMKEDR